MMHHPKNLDSSERSIEVTPEELDLERNRWERDGITLSPETLAKLVHDRKEYDLWSGLKMGKEGD